jgi:hypothetical protein
MLWLDRHEIIKVEVVKVTECAWLFCFEKGIVEMLYPDGEVYWFCVEHTAPADFPAGCVVV